ncbi:NAD(P)-binding protein [Glonium stellatum]|uniref:NAD(P)-binding protein n=1 Tax=Glonium stellatum TaxID=574774 RepID=A0A8E2FE01_9PEZI|nr:NAD(P)-binding protein [Glonium stellatum]
MPSKYAAVHVSTNGPGDARPTALQIVQDEGLEGKLQGKVALVTGCSSGIGIETVRALAVAGATVYAAVRDLEKGKAALGDVLSSGRVELLKLDLSSLSSVRECAKEFLAKSNTLNILINNAGIMACPEGRTVDGFEMQFGTNHLGHFLLFNLLKPTLLASSSPSFNSRVINISSTAHRYSQIHFDNISLEGEYQPWIGYGQSKIANIYMANELDRRYGSKGLHALSVHPGGIVSGLQQYMPEEQLKQWDTPEVHAHMKSPAQGAATTVWAAISKEWEGKGGKYLQDCQVAEPVEEGYHQLSPGYEKYAYDPEKEKKLWKLSLEMVGLEDDE